MKKNIKKTFVNVNKKCYPLLLVFYILTKSLWYELCSSNIMVLHDWVWYWYNTKSK